MFIPLIIKLEMYVRGVNAIDALHGFPRRPPEHARLEHADPLVHDNRRLNRGCASKQVSVGMRNAEHAIHCDRGGFRCSRERDRVPQLGSGSKCAGATALRGRASTGTGASTIRRRRRRSSGRSAPCDAALQQLAGLGRIGRTLVGKRMVTYKVSEHW